MSQSFDSGNITEDEASSFQNSDILNFPNGEEQQEQLEDQTAGIIDQQHQSQQEREEDQDPLGITQLSLAYNYTLYKIQDSLQSLTLQTKEYLDHQSDIINKDLADFDTQMDQLRDTIKRCSDLKMRFDTIEQIGYIVKDFEGRVGALETKLVVLKQMKSQNGNKSMKQSLRGH